MEYVDEEQPNPSPGTQAKTLGRNLILGRGQFHPCIPAQFNSHNRHCIESHSHTSRKHSRDLLWPVFLISKTRALSFSMMDIGRASLSPLRHYNSTIRPVMYKCSKAYA